MQLKELTSKLIKPERLAVTDWPSEIYPPSESTGGIFGFGAENSFWRKVKDLREFTDRSSDKFSEGHQGSTGWEYGFDLVVVEGKYFYTQSYTSRNYEQVQSQTSLKVEPSWQDYGSAGKKILVDKIFLNQVEVGKINYIEEPQIKERIAKAYDGKLQIGFISSFHSHPRNQYVLPNGQKYFIYTFFSEQDLKSLMGGRSHMLGLVTDRLWIAARTDTSSMPSQAELSAITQLEYDITLKQTREGITPNGNSAEYQEFINLASDTFRKHNIVLYMAKFGSKLAKV